MQSFVTCVICAPGVAFARAGQRWFKKRFINVDDLIPVSVTSGKSHRCKASSRSVNQLLTASRCEETCL